MEPDQLAQYLENAPLIIQYILMGLGSLVVAGYAYVKITPNQDDDAWLQKLEEKAMIGYALKLLTRFAPIQRKPLTVETKTPLNG